MGLLLFAAGERALWSNERVLTFVSRYTPPGPDGDPLLVAASLRTLGPAPADAPAPVLLLGSSQVREGLDCAAFEARLPGRACRNFAVSAGSPLDVLAIADRYDAQVPRRVSVLGLFPKLLQLAPKAGFVDASTFACVFASGSWRRLAATQWLELTGGGLEALVPTLRFKDALGAFYGVVRPDPRAAWALALPPQPQRLLAGQRPQPAVYFERHAGHVDGDAPRPGGFTGAQEEALTRFLEREHARGNTVLLIDFPTHPSYDSTQWPETLERYRACLARMRRRPGVVFLEAADLGPLEFSDFQDFTHLAQSGRAKVSQRVAERLADVLASR